MDPHCALKVTRHLLKNKRHYHHNAIDRFGLNRHKEEYKEIRTANDSDTEHTDSIIPRRVRSHARDAVVSYV